ncbi:MAG TPA: cytochrome c [Caulobacteraceae bacterium]|jgi:mono/diheme cytochrome c family protein|nr:cytochrome c [Caulobacteraceae bacterium]
MAHSCATAVALAGLAVLAAGCAAEGGPVRVGRYEDLAARGAVIARTRCSGCHAIDLASDSPRASAPPFRVLRIRFNEITWERTTRAISEGGHDEMPPVPIDELDARDLRTFINSLK